jgi:nucleoside-diphosphate-sugar epimerase
MDLVLTGATGFLGSHLLLQWLRDHPDRRALAVVRSAHGQRSAQRLHQALAGAAADSDVRVDVDRLLRAVTVLDADVRRLQAADRAVVRRWAARGPGFDLLHSAADLSFREGDRDRVWAANVDGTRRLVDAVAGAPGLRSLNHVSTAYVAGTATGRIREDSASPPPGFNNGYERSKWHAEQVVRERAAELGADVRIFRPSIVIGHSQTLRTSAATGFYKILDMLHRFAPAVAERGSVIAVPSCRGATLDLVPIDLVVAELLALLEGGPATAGRVYHLTNEHPLTISDVLFGVAPLLGLRMRATTAVDGRTDDGLGGVLTGAIRHYLPYFGQQRTFDRRNVHAGGAGQFQQGYRLDLVALREFATAYLDRAHVDRAPVLPAGLTA